MPTRIKHPAFPAGTVPLGRLADLKLSERDDADRLTTRPNGLGWATEYVVERWPSRGAMLAACQMQARGPSQGKRLYRPVVPD